MGIFQKKEEEEYRISKLDKILPENGDNAIQQYLYTIDEDEFENEDENKDECNNLVKSYEEEEKEMLKKKPKGKVLIYGFLKKRSRYLMIWKTRFFILTNHYLFAFSGVENDADCTMALNVLNIIGIEKIKEENNNGYTFLIKSSQNDYYLRAEEEQFREIWINEIENIVKYNNRQMDSIL